MGRSSRGTGGFAYIFKTVPSDVNTAAGEMRDIWMGSVGIEGHTPQIQARRNRTLIYNGYASAYTFQHLNLNAEYRRNITFVNFRGGHMVYNDAAALKEMKRTLDSWYADVLKMPK